MKGGPGRTRPGQDERRSVQLHPVILYNFKPVMTGCHLDQSAAKAEVFGLGERRIARVREGDLHPAPGTGSSEQLEPEVLVDPGEIEACGGRLRLIVVVSVRLGRIATGQ